MRGGGGWGAIGEFATNIYGLREVSSLPETKNKEDEPLDISEVHVPASRFPD